MELPFIKMHTAGRDVVLIDSTRAKGAEELLESPSAARILDRRLGIGGHELIILARTDDPPLTVTSARGTASGQAVATNTLLSAARFAIDAGLVSHTSFRLAADGHLMEVEALDSQSIMADLGPPRTYDGKEQLTERAASSYTHTLLVQERALVYTPLRLRGSHAVFYSLPFATSMARSIAAEHPLPDDPSDGPPHLCFASALDSNRLKVRTWEAGRGEDHSHADSAAAGVVAGVLHGFVERDTMTRTRGGDLYVLWANQDNRVYVTGAPRYVFTGTYSTD